MLPPNEMDPAFDATAAAPEFHRVILENDEVRVLEVVIEPGAREPFHTHRWQSIFVVMGTPHLRYFVPQSDSPLFEIAPQHEAGVLHLAPEGLHALENIDRRRLHAFRVEMTRAPIGPPQEGANGPIIQTGTPGKDLHLDNPIVRVRRGSTHSNADQLSSVILFPGQSCAVWATRPQHLAMVGEEEIVVSFKYPGLSR